MRSALLCDVSEGRLVVSYRRSWTDCPEFYTYTFNCTYTCSLPIPTVYCILDAHVQAWSTYSQLHSGCLSTGLTYLQSTAFWMLMYGPDLLTVNCILDAYIQAWPTYNQLHSGCLCTGLTYYSQLHSGYLCIGMTYLPTVNCILDAYVWAWPPYSKLHSECLCTGLTYLQ
jgi:hypothetical protein